MSGLASTIRDQLDTCTVEYDRRLQKIRDYFNMPAQVRLGVARQVLSLVVECLADGEDEKFERFIEDMAGQRVGQGFEADSMLQSLAALEAVLEPRISDAPTAKFLWSMLSKARDVAVFQATAALRASESKLRQMVDRSPVGFYHTTPAGRIVDANQAFFQIVGYDSLEAINHVGVPSLYRDPADRHRLLALLQQGPVTGFETTFRRADGQIINVSLSARLVQEAGAVTYLEGILEDVTGRKLAEEALQESEARFRSVVESAPIGIFIVDDASKFVYVNDELCQILGYLGEEIVGRDFQAFLDEESRQIVVDRYIRRQRGEEVPARYEFNVIRKSGEKRRVEISSTVIRDLVGNVRTVGQLLDITERKQAEQALQESQQLLRLVMNSIPQTIFWKDKNVVYLGCNREFAEDAGLASPEDVIGKTDRDMPWKEQVELYQADDRQVMETGVPKLNYEEPQTTPEGKQIWLRTSKIPMRDAQGNVIAVLGMYEDITERKRLEHEIQESLERRGHQVQVSTQVAQEIAAAPALEELYRRVVTLIKERFGYYHVQIFRYEPVQDAVVLVVGYGEAGDKMLAAGHKLTMGRGVVGTAAATGKSILATDTAQDPDWRPNPNLPETKGELAVPIKLRDEVLGILDVQSDRANLLGEDDRLLLEGLCGQIAVAMESTHLLQEANTFRQFVETSGQGFGMSTLQGEVVYMNPTLYHLLGESRLQDAIGKPIASFYPPEMQKRLVEQVLPTVMKEGQWTGELALVSKTGQVTPTLESFFLLRDEQGNPRFLADVMTDITERKQAEARMQETLSELERLYRATAREGWQAFRQATEMPSGYMFDRLSVRPADAERVWTPVIEQAIKQNALVPPSAEQAVAVAPLAVRGQVIGAVGVYDDPQRPLSPEELELVQEITEQGALALESARLFEQTQAALSEAQVLYQASAELNSAQTYNDVLAALQKHTLLSRASLGVNISLFDTVWTGDRMPQWVQVIAQTGSLSSELVALRYDLAQFPVAHLLRPDELLLVPDVEHDPRLDDNTRNLYLGVLGARSMVAIPLVVGGQWIGYISAIWSQPTRFAEAEVRRMMPLSSQAATVVQTIRQLEETQNRAGREQVLRQALAVINASQDLPASLPEIEEHLRKLVPLDTLAMTMYTPGDPEYTLFAFRPEKEGGQLVLQRTRLAVRGTTSGWVIGQKRPRLDADLRESKLFMEDADLVAAGMVSRLVLPLKLGDQVVGTLNLASSQPGIHTEEHVSMLLPVTEQLALALERVRLLEETRAALAEVEATQRRYLREKWESYLATVTETPTGYVDGPGGLVSVGEETSPTSVSAGNVLSVPLKLRGEPIGVLEFYSEDASRTWTDDERTLVEALADQAALALENARLLDETQSRAQREQLINEITARIRASMDMETILQTTTEELSKALNLSRARIRLGAGDGDDGQK